MTRSDAFQRTDYDFLQAFCGFNFFTTASKLIHQTQYKRAVDLKAFPRINTQFKKIKIKTIKLFFLNVHSTKHVALKSV